MEFDLCERETTTDGVALFLLYGILYERTQLNAPFSESLPCSVIVLRHCV